MVLLLNINITFSFDNYGEIISTSSFVIYLLYYFSSKLFKINFSSITALAIFRIAPIFYTIIFILHAIITGYRFDNIATLTSIMVMVICYLDYVADYSEFFPKLTGTIKSLASSGWTLSAVFFTINLSAHFTLNPRIHSLITATVLFALFMASVKSKWQFIQLSSSTISILFTINMVVSNYLYELKGISIITLWLSVFIYYLKRENIYYRILLYIKLLITPALSLYALNLVTDIHSLIFITALLSLGVIVIPKKLTNRHKEMDILGGAATYISYIVLFFSSIINEEFVMILVYTIVSNLIIFYMKKHVIVGINFFAFFVIYGLFDSYDMTNSFTASIVSMTLGVLFIIIGRLYNKSIITVKPLMVNVYAITAIMGFILGGNHSSEMDFVSVVLSTIYFLQFYRRQGKILDHFSLIMATVMAYFLWNVQPFFRYPTGYKEEILGLMILTAILLINKFTPYDKIGYGFGIATTIYLGVNLLIYEHIISSLLLGGAMLILFLYSFFIKRIRWLSLSLVTMVILGFYISREFWFNLSWLVYLLIAGTTLIIIAINAEKQKVKRVELIGKFKEWEF